MAEQVLFVDDEPAILDGYRRLLYRDFLISTAVGGEQGLLTLKEKGPFAVVVSDMRMPQMDGVEFLLRVKEASPDTVRLILTGQTELQAAIDAVNLGSVFRFLTKPCSRDVLTSAIQASLRQHHLVRVEKDLLEQTLSSSIQVLIEILSLVSPASFGRAMRLRRAVRHVAMHMGREGSWQIEVAAMLSQLGCVTLPPETIEAAYAGKTLPAADQQRFDKHPLAAWELLSHIPRMEQVAWMIAQQMGPVMSLKGKFDGLSSEEKRQLQFGASVLRIALQYDGLLIRGSAHEQAVAKLSNGGSDHADPLLPAILSALKDWDRTSEGGVVRSTTIRGLERGMVLHEDIFTHQGMLIVARGQEVTQTLMLKLQTFWQHGAIKETVQVTVPSSAPLPRSIENEVLSIARGRA